MLDGGPLMQRVARLVPARAWLALREPISSFVDSMRLNATKLGQNSPNVALNGHTPSHLATSILGSSPVVPQGRISRSTTLCALFSIADLRASHLPFRPAGLLCI